MYYFINNKFVHSSKAKISFHDSGFLFGDGLFETMRFDNSKIFSIDNHLNRLMKGLEIIDLKINKSKNELTKILYNVINKNSAKDGIIRLMITRGSSNKIDEDYKVPSIYISIKNFYDIPEKPVKIIYFNEEKYPIIRFKPAIKSMNYLGNMLAKKDADTAGAFEPVFFNKNNIITECAIRNIFYIKNNILFTPALDLGILSGVMRDIVIQIAKALNIEVQESYISYEEVDKMDEAFITSTGIGLLPCYWDGWTSDFALTKLIKKELFKRIKNN